MSCVTLMVNRSDRRFQTLSPRMAARGCETDQQNEARGNPSRPGLHPTPDNQAGYMTATEFQIAPAIQPLTRAGSIYAWRSEADSNSRCRCPTWGKLYRNSHFGTHFGPKNLGFSGLSLGFKSLLLHHPVPQFSDISENRSKSTRVRGFVLPGGPRKSSKTALRRIIGQKLSSSHFGRSILTNWRIATKPRIRSIRSIAE